MTHKRILDPRRIRKVPEQFSWLDHRLVRDRHICSCPPPALALYLFLVTVADAEGLSYYSDPRLAEFLSMTPTQLAQARQSLVRAGLVAYQKPLYQVLSLEPAALPSEAPAARRAGGVRSFDDILAGMIGGAR